jgi:PST family polysaccharide transporter
VISEAHKKHSYGQILKSSSIIGGAQGINYLIGMVRVKLVAVLLGPSGVGLVGLYVSATGLVSTVAGLGINSSGVREVAEAHGTGKAEHIARTVKTLRRACWVTGILGWLLCAALSYPLSVYTFGSGEHAWAVAILGVTILIGTVSGGQSALIQGTRRIGDLARMNVLGAVSGTLVAVGLYGWLGQKGIVPVIIVTAACNLGFSWWFARKIPVAPVTLTWPETLANSKRLFGLGLSFMWSGLAGAVVAVGIQSLIVRYHGLDANGVYQAAWGISGVFGGFIINAMGTDFYPRLTASISDHKEAVRLVNEQTEIGVLLAMPGLQATLAFAPWVMHLLYSAKFLPGAGLLVWFVAAVFCRMVTFPMGFILLAKGAGSRYAIITSIFHVFNIGLCAYLLPRFSLVSIAVANASLAALYVFGMRAIAGPLIEFRWAASTQRLILGSSMLVVLGLFSYLMLPGIWAIVFGTLLTMLSCVCCLRSVASRLGNSHRIMNRICLIPGIKWIAGI